MVSDAEASRSRGAVRGAKSDASGVKLSADGALLHRQLYVLLKEQIVSGRYRPGDALPTQEALCRQFSISRITVRRALSDLAEDGFVRNRQGVGAFVTAKTIDTKHGPDFGFIGDLRRTIKETTMRILALEVERCPRPIAAHLGIADGEQALHLVRVRSFENKPVTLLDGWIPMPFGGVAQEVNAALADPFVARALDIEINSATLKIDRLVHNRDGAPVHYVTVWTTPRRTRLVMEVSADDIDGYNVGRLLHDVQK